MFPARDIILNALGQRTASFVGDGCVIDDPMFALDRTFRSLLVAAGPAADTAAATYAPLPPKSMGVAFDLRVPQLGDRVLNPQLPTPSGPPPAGQRPITTLVLLFLTEPLVPDAGQIEHLGRRVVAHVGADCSWAGGFVPMDGTDRRVVDD